MITLEHTHTHTSVPALLTWQRSWYFIKIIYSEPNISAPASVTVGTRLKYKAYNLHNKTDTYLRNSDMLHRKYGNIMEYLDLCRMREVGYTSTKLHFANSWVRKPLKYVILLCQSMWETHSESAHGHCLGGFVFKCATQGIRCSSADG